MTGTARGTDAVSALFVPDGDALVPTDLARGPWSPDALHGGPVAAVVTRAVERACRPTTACASTRLTLELLRPVGTAPAHRRRPGCRPGRKVQVVDTVVSQYGVEVAWGRAVRIRVDPALAGPCRPSPEDPAPDRTGVRDGDPVEVQGYPGFHNGGMEIRLRRRPHRPTRAGRRPGSGWPCPVVAGEEPTPVQRAMAVADFGNGISSELDFGTGTFINPDLTVYLHPPTGG